MITITITGNTYEECLEQARQMSGNSQQIAPPAPQPVQPAAIPAAATTPAQPVVTPAIPVSAPASAPIPTAQIPTAAAPAYTLEQLSRATCVLSDANRVPEIQELFTSFGIGSLVELNPAQYGAYAAALRQKGVTI